MTWVLRWLRTSLGSKVVMAVTGLLLFFFLVGHMAGNLLVFRGQQAMNDYAYFLQHSTGLLWTARLGLLALFALHVAIGLRLTRDNRGARPERYAHEDTVQASFASRSMILSGLVVAAFLVYHLAHFTLGWIQSGNYALRDATGRHDVYTMVVLGFRNPVVALSYVVAVLLLGLHLSHGLQSLFQSLGLRHRRYSPLIGTAAPIVAALLVAGFLSVPFSVLLGIVQPPQ
ncbi:MAG: succinate dehydrogenase cytochrome b subunit [Planctomycetota bacterium]